MERKHSTAAVDPRNDIEGEPLIGQRSKLNPSGDSGDAIMTVREVAVYLKLSEATVYKWAKAKKIPAMRIGRNWRFQRQAVEEWLKRETAAG